MILYVDQVESFTKTRSQVLKVKKNASIELSNKQKNHFAARMQWVKTWDVFLYAMPEMVALHTVIFTRSFYYRILQIF